MEPVVRPEVRAGLDAMREFRRDLHRHPELGLREFRTAEAVAARLCAAGIEVESGIAGTGLRAIIRAGAGRSGAGSGRALLLRADMDALPIQELSEAPYASETPGVMHACGHDGHTAILTQTALLLHASAARLPHSVVCAFQPAEEGPGGALPMIEAGVLEDPHCDAAFGLHLWTGLPVGKIGVTSGPAMAAADEFEILIEGRGGHGAFPHEAIDAVVMGSYLVTALQTLVSRNADPMRTAVVTIGTFHAGSNFNIIAESARLTGTLRTFDTRLRSLLVRRLREVAEGTVQTLGGKCAFHFTDRYPATVNDPEMAAFAAEVASGLVGPENVVRDLVMMGAEDMSYFLQSVPGCYVFLGAGNEARGLNHPHHSPHFDFDEGAMAIGSELLLRIAERWGKTK